MPNHRGSYRRRLQALLTGQGAAYGFTLTIWSTGTLARETYGPFSLTRIALFILGPLVTYAALLRVVYHPRQAPVSLAEIRYTPFGFVDILSVPAAVGAALLVFRFIPNPEWGIPVGSLFATLVYNLLLATQLLIFQGSTEPPEH